MTGPDAAHDDSSAEHIPFEEFRNGLAHGRFRVIVNPELAQRFVARRVNVVPVAIAVIGCGIASALAGYPVVGAVLVIGGILLRRVIKRQAAKILLHLASTQASTYYDATTNGVMEVQRSPA
jgi:hypothetical protein